MKAELILTRIIDRAVYWREKAVSEQVAGRSRNAIDFEQRAHGLEGLYDSLIEEIKQEARSHGVSTSNH